MKEKIQDSLKGILSDLYDNSDFDIDVFCYSWTIMFSGCRLGVFDQIFVFSSGGFLAGW